MNTKHTRILWLQNKIAGMEIGSHVRRRYEEELWRLLDDPA